MNEIINVVMGLVVVLFMIYMFGKLADDETKYIYECVDYTGNLIYCEYAEISKGGMFGWTEDGTKMVLKSYKRIEKKDMEREGEN